MNITDFQTQVAEATTNSDIISAGASYFLPSVVFFYFAVLLLMLVMGASIIQRDKGNFYSIFVFTWLVAGIILFFIFMFPVIPQFLEQILGGLI